MFDIIILAFLLSAKTVFTECVATPDASTAQGKLSSVCAKPKKILDTTSDSDTLYQLVLKSEYELAVNLTIAIANTAAGEEIITETVKKLFDNPTPVVPSQCSCANHNVMSYAYQLFKTAKDIVAQYFPEIFYNVLNEDQVRIVNKEYNLPLKLALAADASGDRQAYGDGSDSNPDRLTWKFEPMGDGVNGVVYKIYNYFQNYFLKLAVSPDSNGYRLAYGSSDSDTDRHKFYLEAQNDGNEMVFYIVNYMYCQGLQLSDETDSIEDREVRAHDGDICPAMDSFKWIITKI